MIRFRRILGKRCGFTLIELLIVIIIVAILFGAISHSCSANNTAVAIKKSENGIIYRPLVQIPDQGIISGVCAGIGYKWGIDPWIPRTLFLIGTFVIGGGIIIYIVFALFLDSAPTPEDFNTRISGVS